MYCSIFIVFLALSGSAMSEEWPNARALGPGFLLQWRDDGDAIEMEITAPTAGWVGIGFGVRKTMANADLIIGGVRNGEPYLWDCHAQYNGPPTIDQEQNVDIISARENSTHTSIIVARSLTLDDNFDRTITNGDMTILWAFGNSDKEREWQNSNYHGRNRGAVEMVLLGNAEDPISKDIGSTTIFTVSIPATAKSTSPKLTRPNEQEPALPFVAILDEDTHVTLYWAFDSTTITMQIVAPTTGWIGLGFGRTVSMNGADIIMMGVKEDGAYVLDCHSDRNGVPDVDDEQNVEVVAGWENGTHTGVTIRRKRLTCNPDDMDVQLPSTYRVLWSYGEEDLKDHSPSSRYYHHRNRGGRSLQLIYPSEYKASAGNTGEETHIDLRGGDFRVPPVETYYSCKFVKLTEANETIYATGLQPIIKKENERNVHHMITYICDVDITEEQLQRQYQCYQDIHPFSMGCNKLLGGWAVGSTGMRYPRKSGYRLGGLDHPQYVMIEMHYDNPEKKEFFDNSGMRLSFVREKPEVLSSIFDVSQTLPTIWVPPGAGRYRIGGHCREECVSKGMEKAGVSEVEVFGVFLHSHLAGRSMRLRHFRNGMELQAMARDEYYDFDYQETQYFEEPIILKRGDSLTLECDYSTANRKKVTTGGLPTTSEMCVAFIMHYPPMEMSTCGSRANIDDPKVFFELAAGLNISLKPTDFVRVANEMRGDFRNAMAIFARNVLDDIKWTDEKRKFAQDFTDNMTLHTTCLNQRELLMPFRDEFVLPRVNDYVEDQPICPGAGQGADDLEDSSVKIMSGLAAAMVILILGAAVAVTRKT